MYDYYFDLDYRTHSAELQDIAAMDRLAAQAAPASALHRYGESHGGTRRPGVGTELVERLRHALHLGSARHAAPTVTTHR